MVTSSLSSRISEDESDPEVGSCLDRDPKAGLEENEVETDGGGGMDRARLIQLGMAVDCFLTGGGEGIDSLLGITDVCPEDEDNMRAFSKMASMAELLALVMLRGDEGSANEDLFSRPFTVRRLVSPAPNGLVELALMRRTTPNNFLDSPLV